MKHTKFYTLAAASLVAFFIYGQWQRRQYTEEQRMVDRAV